MEASAPLPQPPRNSDEMYAFEIGAQSVFSSWTALVLGVENEFGGSRSRDKAQSIFEDFLDLFYRTFGCSCSYTWKRELSDVDKLYEYLDQRLDDLLNLEIEDGSVEKVLAAIWRLYETCAVKDYSFLNEVLKAGAKKPNDVIWGGKKVTQWPPQEVKAPRSRPNPADFAEDPIPVDVSLNSERRLQEGDSSDGDDDDDDDDDNMVIEARDEKGSNSKPETDDKPKDPEDDGWTTVTKKGKKGR